MIKKGETNETERKITKYKKVLEKSKEVELLLKKFLKLEGKEEKEVEKKKTAKTKSHKNKLNEIEKKIEKIQNEKEKIKIEFEKIREEINKNNSKISELKREDIINLQANLHEQLIKLNINNQSQKDKTLLHIKTRENSIDEVKLLADNHGLVNLDIKDKNGETALHIACHQLNEEVIKELVENGANLNIRNNDGDTVLNVLLKQYSNSNENDNNKQINNIVRELIEKGANYLIINDDKKSALDVAIETKNKDIIRFILDEEKRKNEEREEEISEYVKDINFQNQEDGQIIENAIEQYVKVKVGVDITKKDKLDIVDIENIAKLYSGNTTNNKIEVSEREEITQEKMDKMIIEEPVYVRGLQGLSGIIKNDRSHKDTIKMKYIESGGGAEARKLIRVVGDMTFTKIRGTKEGNPNRCFTMINFGKLEPFVTVGYGITKIDISKIHFVADKDAWSRVNKEEGIIEINDKDVKNSVDNLSADIKVRKIFSDLRDGKSKKITSKDVKEAKKNKGKNPLNEKETKEHNELIIDVAEKDVGFIYYFNWNKVYNEDYNKLQAAYFRKVYQEKTGRTLPIFDYKMNKKKCFKLHNIDEKEIKKLILKEMLRNTPAGKVLKDEYKNISATDFWIVLKDEIKAVDKDDKLLREFLDEQKDKELDIYDVINLFRIKKEFQGVKELESKNTQKEFIEKLKPLLDTDKILNFIEDRTVRPYYTNKRLNRKLDFWFNIVSQIYELSTNDTKKELSKTIEKITNEIYKKNKEEDKEKNVEKMLNNGLYYAVERGDIELAEELIKDGADVNYIKKEITEVEDKQTKVTKRIEIIKEPVLIEAVRKNNREIFKLLIDNNADVNIVNKEGKTAKEIANSLKYKDILEELEKVRKGKTVVLERINEVEKIKKQAKEF